jgi:hypothetical protein
MNSIATIGISDFVTLTRSWKEQDSHKKQQTRINKTFVQTSGDFLFFAYTICKVHDPRRNSGPRHTS